MNNKIDEKMLNISKKILKVGNSNFLKKTFNMCIYSNELTI